MRWAWFTLLLWVVCPGCHSPRKDASESGAGPAEWHEWRAKRVESLAGPRGWTTLIGRFWLEPGTHSAGSDPSNPILLPTGRAAARVGTFERVGRRVIFHAADGVAATVNGNPVKDIELVSDHEPQPTRLDLGELSVVVIERGERIGLRVRDPESPTRRAFKGIPTFPYAAAWKLTGRFEPFPSPRTLRVPTVIGGTESFPSPGAVVFQWKGREHRLDVAQESGESRYFVMFKDATSGRSTYPAGRFLYVSRADGSGVVTVDFNQAYTPPCGYTRFATCPLPPPQNVLPFRVEAGEKTPPHPH